MNPQLAIVPWSLDLPPTSYILTSLYFFDIDEESRHE